MTEAAIVADSPRGARRIVVKVGSSLVTNEGRGLDADAIGAWCRQLAVLAGQGREVVMVSSGAIAAELKKFSPELAARERWLVLNKLDLMPADEAEKRCKDIVRRLRWKGPVHRISGATRTGTAELCQAIMRRLDEIEAEQRAADPAG